MIFAILKFIKTHFQNFHFDIYIYNSLFKYNMINIRLIAFFVLLFFIKTDDRVNIDIYTESLCPDCIRFIKTSFE